MGNERIRPFQPEDAPELTALMRLTLDRRETLYRPIPPETWTSLPQGSRVLVAEEADGRLAGFAAACEKTVFLPGETAGNTPLYLTLLLVRPESRGKGVGTALLDAVKALAVSRGKSRLVIGSDQPLHLTWLIPDTPGHDHNNAPGLWKEGGAGPWFERRGFESVFEEMSLYIRLSDYRWDADIEARQRALAAEGIYTGFWTPEAGSDFDGMCDRVGSEYWRHVLQTELEAWKEHAPNRDPDLWPDGRMPAGPRPLLVAARDGRLIGFTGPVDRQASGRGWFTGICVDPEAGGRGIGTVLFHLLLRAFIRDGAAFCSIFTGVGNHAQKIYLRAGMRVTSHWQVMSCPVSAGEFQAYRYF